MPSIDKNIFKEYDIRGRYPEEIDDRCAYQLGRAFVDLKKTKKIIVARDFRPESEMMSYHFIKGVLDSGCDVYDLGIDSTPLMFFGVSTGDHDGGAIMTASHNPAGYSGIKMCGSDGVILGSKTGLSEIEKKANKNFKDSKKRGSKKKISIFSEYYKNIFSFVDKDGISGFKMVIDSSGGSGSKILDYVFNRISSKIIKMNFRPYDKYPDHGLNPMLVKNYSSIEKEVKNVKADIGVLCDGDGDRTIFIDDRGRFVHPVYINCLLAKIILSEKKGINILVDARLAQNLPEVITDFGGKAVVHRSGYANIVKTMRSKKVLFGCENSGHYLFNLKLIGQKNYVYGDAIIPILMILEFLKKNNLKLSQALKEFKDRFCISGEINIKNVDLEKIEPKIEKKYSKHKIQKIDGISVCSDSWFFNVRPSHTEPLVRLNVESKDKKVLVKIKKELLKIIK